MTTFTPPPTTPLICGFTAGVIRITWARDNSYTISGRDGQMFAAEITEMHVRATLPTDVIRQALHNLIVRAPDGRLSRITGVEMFCMHSQGADATLGILLVPLEES